MKWLDAITDSILVLGAGSLLAILSYAFFCEVFR